MINIYLAENYDNLTHSFIPSLYQYLAFPNGPADRLASDRYLLELLEHEEVFKIPCDVVYVAFDISQKKNVRFFDVCNFAKDYEELKDYDLLFLDAMRFISKYQCKSALMNIDILRSVKEMLKDD